MKRIIPLSLVAVASLYAAEVELAPIGVESTVITEVAANAQVSADLAEALSVKVPSIDMNRRSGIANDIYIRGQKRDNISVEVDGTKTCGACVNRMDPPVSHVLASQIESVEVIEGPYDVETFGTMSGGVKITTKKPSKDLSGEVELGLGSWNYRKFGATVSGGNDIIRVLISASKETSDQYEDGDGNTMAEQLEKSGNATLPGTAYKTDDEDMKAYEKKSIMAKTYINITDNQELRLSYTGNRSDDILYPNSSMDAVYDDSNIYSVEYNIQDISDVYKNINLQFYHSDVNHPMSTEYRNSSNAAAGDKTNHLKTSMNGLKLKNSFDIQDHKLMIGLDASDRVWDGEYYNTTTGDPLPVNATGTSKSIDNAVTKNRAIFAKLEKTYGNLTVNMGARYDSTKITSDDSRQQDNKYNGLNANLLLSYQLDKANRIFFGVGQAYRVPDGRELYNQKSNAGSTLDGTDDLEQTRNREIDLGYELTSDMFNFKIKGFYSDLSDFIYYQKSGGANNFKNIDAKIYGGEVTAEYFATDDITVDAGISYKRGKKDEALVDKDTDLADIAPLRGNIAVNYEYMNNSIVTVEVQASDKWDTIDSEAGEQELDSWAIMNLKVKHEINKNFEFTLGVNNLFDKTYIKSNSYFDLILLDNTFLMNEPGRYVYTNVKYRF